MVLFIWVYPPLSTRQKIKNGFPFDNVGYVLKNRGCQKMKSGLNGVGVNSNGLKLWENDATGLKIIF